MYISSTFLLFFFLMTPYTAPSVPLLLIARILTALFFFSIASAPIINDTVTINSRGKAVSFNSMSIIFAEIIAVGILF
jgi:hypothetical protein